MAKTLTQTRTEYITFAKKATHKAGLKLHVGKFKANLEPQLTPLKGGGYGLKEHTDPYLISTIARSLR